MCGPSTVPRCLGVAALQVCPGRRRDPGAQVAVRLCGCALLCTAGHQNRKEEEPC
eukprot:COSAG01_NODE_5334_length_4326_cov_144.633073_2_plen_55_part_00